MISFGLVPIEIFKRIIDEAIPAKNISLVFIMVGIIIGTHITKLIIRYFHDLLLTKMQLDVARNMQIDFFKKYQETKTTKFDTGQLMEIIIYDVKEVTKSVFNLIISPILDIIGILITIAYMFTVSPILALVSIAFIPIFLGSIIPVNKIIRKEYTQIKKAYAKIYSTFEKKLIKFSNVLKTNSHKKERKDLDKKIKQFDNVDYDFKKFSIKIQSYLELIGDIAPYTVLLVATYLIIEGRFEVGTFIAFSMLMPRLFGPVKSLASKEVEFQTLIVTAKRVFGKLDKATQKKK